MQHRQEFRILLCIPPISTKHTPFSRGRCYNPAAVFLNFLIVGFSFIYTLESLLNQIKCLCTFPFFHNALKLSNPYQRSRHLNLCISAQDRRMDGMPFFQSGSRLLEHSSLFSLPCLGIFYNPQHRDLPRMSTKETFYESYTLEHKILEQGIPHRLLKPTHHSHCT